MNTKFAAMCRMTLMAAVAGIATMNVAATAQTTNAPAPVTTDTFLSSAKSYFTSFDTNSTTFESHNLRIWTGPDYQSQLNVDSAIGVQYRIHNFGSAPINGAATPVSLGAESVIRNAGIAGTIENGQIGVGVMADYYDVELSGWVDGGYSLYNKSGYGAAAAQVCKAATANTFVGVRMEEQFFGRSPNPPLIAIMVGGTF